MITYLLESGLSLLVLLGLYKLLLERQAMHRLKRVYLLGTLLVSGVAPLLSVEVPPERLPAPVVGLLAPTLPAAKRLSATFRPPRLAGAEHTQPLVETSAQPHRPEPMALGWWVYGFVTALMLSRFGRNLYRLGRQVRRHPKQRWQGITVVLLPGEVLPHTFLRYLFVAKTAYEQGHIEPELFTHERAHIRQWHSLDVLLAEVALCFGWFNPGLFWLKRAMQLNHEHLADEAVNATHRNVSAYQHLLLAKLTHPAPASALVSTLTFQTTKHRLLMMTKHASPARTWLAGAATAVLFGTTAFMVATTATTPTVAQVKPTPKQATSATTTPAPRQADVTQLSIEEMERRFGDKLVSIYKKGVGIRKKTFSTLTPELQRRVVYFPPDSPKSPTEAEFDAFKYSKKYGIWLDEKRDRNFSKTTLKASDIVHFSGSYVHKNARQPEGYLYQMELYTKAGYEKYLKYFEENPMLILDPTAKPQAR